MTENLLIHESSLYLLQHADNPVHWYPWDDAALAHARATQNPIPIIVPCHRVIATRGGMSGYSGRGGLDTKRVLLILEGVVLA